MHRPLLFLLCLSAAACTPRCGKEPPPEFFPQAQSPAMPEAAEEPTTEGEAMHALLREPSAEELHALGIALPAGHQAVTGTLREALEGLPEGNLRERALALGRLSEANPWHALAEAAAFAAIAAWHALGSCEETLEAGTSFVQAWPQGAYAPEVWLLMALCQKQSGHFSEFEETLSFLSRRYPRTPAGLKAKVELNLRASINELK